MVARKCLSLFNGFVVHFLNAEMSSCLNVETEPRMVQIIDESPMCSFTLPDICLTSLLLL